MAGKTSPRLFVHWSESIALCCNRAMLGGLSNLLSAFLSCTLMLHVPTRSRCSDGRPGVFSLHMREHFEAEFLLKDKASQRATFSCSHPFMFESEFHDGVALEPATASRPFHVSLSSSRGARPAVTWTEGKPVTAFVFFPLRVTVNTHGFYYSTHLLFILGGQLSGFPLSEVRCFGFKYRKHGMQHQSWLMVLNMHKAHSPLVNVQL